MEVISNNTGHPANELTIKCIQNGWNPEDRSVPFDENGNINLRDYFNIPTHIEGDLLYNLETQVPNYTSNLTFPQIMEVGNFCKNLQNFYKAFKDTNKQITLITGMEIK